jgi:hypothetical protein
VLDRFEPGRQQEIDDVFGPCQQDRSNNRQGSPFIAWSGWPIRCRCKAQSLIDACCSDVRFTVTTLVPRRGSTISNVKGKTIQSKRDRFVTRM